MPASYPTPSDPLSAGHIDSGATTEAHSRMHGRVLDVWENVQAYGAIGDGVVDDTASIQACIDAVWNAGGGMVFLPPGTYKVSQSASLNTVCLRLRDGVVIRGSGWSNCIVQAAASLPSPVNNVIGNDGGNNGDPRWMMGLENFRIDGNRANQTRAVWGAEIHKDDWSAFAITYNGETLGSAGLYRVDHMFFYNCKGGGFHFTGNAGGQITNCMAWVCQVGYEALNDSEVIGCLAGVMDLEGFRGFAGSNRFVGCKAYACGATDATTYGFYLRGTSTEVAACEVQQTVGGGFYVDGKSAIIQGVCDQILGSMVKFSATSSGCVVNLAYADVNGPYRAVHAVDNTAGATHNKVFIHFNNSAGTSGTLFSGTTANNYFALANQEGHTTPTYAASYTPFPGAGGYQTITLTGNITVNAPGQDMSVGSKLAFEFIQDGTGSRTITFNSIYKTNWTPATTANDKSFIEFVFDGTDWLQTSYTAVAI